MFPVTSGAVQRAGTSLGHDGAVNSESATCAHEGWRPDGPNLVYLGDNSAALRNLPDEVFQMIYLDPPFNTGRAQRRQTLRAVRSPSGGRIGFKGHAYETVRQGLARYDDVFEDYWAFLEPRLEEAWRVLRRDGTLYLHLDYREVHYAKVVLDALFGRRSFLNEIIWAYDYGARSTRRWPAKHDNILVYVKDPSRYYYDGEAVDREPYMAPGLVTAEKAARGKLPTDVWWHTIVPTSGAEKTGYPTQKPEGIVRRMVQASSAPGDWVLDLFAGSGTLGAVAQRLGRRFVLVDESEVAFEVMKRRLGRGTPGAAVSYAAVSVDHLPRPAHSRAPDPDAAQRAGGRDAGLPDEEPARGKWRHDPARPDPSDAPGESVPGARRARQRGGGGAAVRRLPEQGASARSAGPGHQAETVDAPRTALPPDRGSPR